MPPETMLRGAPWGWNARRSESAVSGLVRIEGPGEASSTKIEDRLYAVRGMIG